jgi:hypothetical protein
MEKQVNRKSPHVVLSCGAVNGAAWVDDRVIGDEVVEVHSIKFDRSYKDKNDGQWKHTEVFYTEDLPKLAMVATELYRRLRLRSYGDKQHDNDISSNTDGLS